MYTINVMDTKTDKFETFTTEATTFGGIKPELQRLGFTVDFKNRSYVVAETSTEIIGDESQLGCCGEMTELTICMYPKDTKAGLTSDEVNALGFAALRKEVANIKAADKAGFEKHLSHLGGNPTTQGLKDALNAYYKSSPGGAAAQATTPAQAPAKSSAPKPATAQAESNNDSLESRVNTLEQRMAELEKALARLSAGQTVEAVKAAKEATPATAAVDPELEKRKAEEAAKEAAKKAAKEKAMKLRDKASKRF